MKRVYTDAETTGFEPGQITQLSYIVEENNQVIKRVNQYLKVSYIAPDAARVTGLTIDRLDRLSDGRVFADRAQEFYDDINGSILIGHNIAFDAKFLSAELFRCGESYVADKRFCTMNFLTPMMQLPRKRGNGFKLPKLEEAMAFLEIKTSDTERFAKAIFGNFPLQAHDSRFDTMAVYLICKKLEKDGMLDIDKLSVVEL